MSKNVNKNKMYKTSIKSNFTDSDNVLISEILNFLEYGKFSEQKEVK
jgi:hypothetical protein